MLRSPLRHVLLISTMFAVVGSDNLLACQYVPITQELVEKADTIFVARVTEARLAKLSVNDQVFEVVEAHYEIKEVIKGNPVAGGIVRDAPVGIGNCNIALYPGIEYVLIPGVHETVTSTTGSFGYTNANAPTTRQVIESIKKFAATAK